MFSDEVFVEDIFWRVVCVCREGVDVFGGVGIANKVWTSCFEGAFPVFSFFCFVYDFFPEWVILGANH